MSIPSYKKKNNAALLIQNKHGEKAKLSAKNWLGWKVDGKIVIKTIQENFVHIPREAGTLPELLLIFFAIDLSPKPIFGR